MTRCLSPRELELASRWLMESPRNRALEVLIILASLFYPIHFWLIERIITLRSRSRPAPDVGSEMGVGNEDGAIAEPKPSVGGHEFSPPLSRRPIPLTALLRRHRR